MSLRIAFFCVALAATVPATSAAFAQATATPPTQTAPAAKPAPVAPATTPAAPTAAKPATPKPATPGQTAAHQRQTACGAEWRAAKEAGKVPAGQKWPQFWSACNKRLKAQGK
ncbi:hypothetical protein V5F32_16950 [Xanthobacter oligotrophicus]|uniref:Uncharacterized protein n=1 Tax=Xanthobacter oligotrophicus TaxID=2607286 RepID=A0ABW6ZZG8_9HYPH